MQRKFFVQSALAHSRELVRSASSLAKPARRVIGQRPIKAAVAVTVMISLYLAINPGIDREVSAVFYANGAGFPATDDPALRLLRLLGRIVTGAVAAGLLVILAGKMLDSLAWRRVTWPVWWFLTGSLALGPGIVVNGILKELWGRARPLQTDDFGGAFAFTPPWFPASSCASNCSFVSGEASAAIFLIAFAFVVSPAWRGAVAAIAICWAALISLNRIAFGAHYLSDVLIAWGLTITVVMVMREVFLIRRDPAAHDWAEALPTAHHSEA